MRWLEPFRKVGASKLRSYIEEASHGRAISKFSIRNNTFQKQETEIWHEKEFKYLLEPVLGLLPDMDVLINEWDEPRILLGGNENTNDTAFEEFQLKSYKNAYLDLVGNPCKGRNISVSHVHDEPFHPYLSDVAGSKDVCRHPEIEEFYGLTQSPNALSVTPSLIPLLSQSKLSSVGGSCNPVYFLSHFISIQHAYIFAS